MIRLRSSRSERIVAYHRDDASREVVVGHTAIVVDVTSREQRKQAARARREAAAAEAGEGRKITDRLRRLRNWLFRDSGGGATRPYPKD